MRLGENRWGKSGVRVSKVLRGEDRDDFLELSVHILLGGDMEAAHTRGDNSLVLPTDTMRNTVYALAQEHLGHDLEAFAELLCARFLSKQGVTRAEVVITQRPWERVTGSGFVATGSGQRLARVVRGSEEVTMAGVEGLTVLKTRGSAFEGFPKDEYTTLPETAERILGTAITAYWSYDPTPSDTSATWESVRDILVERFFADWSASMQHQGYLMGSAVLEAVPEVTEITLRLPNLHHLPFDLTRFGMAWHNTVFHPVSEPYGDISLSVGRGDRAGAPPAGP